MSHTLPTAGLDQRTWATDKARPGLEFCLHHFITPDSAFYFHNRGDNNNLSAAAAKSHQSCLTLCDPIDGSPPGSPVPGILQARTLEWGAIAFSNVWKWKWSRLVVSSSQRPHGLQPTILCPWDFLGKSTGVGCHGLLWIASLLSIKWKAGRELIKVNFLHPIAILSVRYFS